MAAAAESGDRDDLRKRDEPEGHIFEHTFFLLPLSGRLPKTIVREYRTDCRALPTSWRLVFNFKQETNDGPISTSVDLTRIDRIFKPVRVYMWMNCIINSRDLFATVSIRRPAIWPNMVISRTMDPAIIGWEEIKDLLNGNVLLQIFISFEKCHLRASSAKKTVKFAKL